MLICPYCRKEFDEVQNDRCPYCEKKIMDKEIFKKLCRFLWRN